MPQEGAAEQASDPRSPAAGQIDAGLFHTCALLDAGQVRCWGHNGAGQLGYGHKATVGDRATPAGAGPVDLGPGRRAAALSAGDYHTCAILDDATVRCWGFGGNGRLGYASLASIGDNETPASVGPVNLGAGRTAKAITAGGAHTCAVLDDATVRCWGFGYDGQLGYGNPDPDPATPTTEPPPLNVGDDEAPGAVGPVNLGAGRTAKAIAAGELHTCAVLDDDSVRCWGRGSSGQLGYGSSANVGDRGAPALAGPVDLGGGRSARAISAGAVHTCALLDDGNVRCWGFAGGGRVGYGNTTAIGDNETPGSVGPVDLGAGRTASAISVGTDHSCAVLDDSTVRCWGFGRDGRLGHKSMSDVGDDEAPGAVAPVNLGDGARALAAGGRHTCARLDDGARPEDGSVRCWGHGPHGRLGYCSDRNVGDDEPPGALGPVDLGSPDHGAPGCLPPERTGASGAAAQAVAKRAERMRKRKFDSCMRAARRRSAGDLRRARGLSARRRAVALRRAARSSRRLQGACVRRHGRTPGRVTGLTARALSRTSVRLAFTAPGSAGARGPAARTYVIKQSRRPIRSARAFRRAQTLCYRRCRFAGATTVGARLTLKVTDLRPGTTYHYAVAARDNVSGKHGRRARAAKARTR